MMISISSEFEAAGGLCGWEYGVVFDSPGNSVSGDKTVSGEGVISGWGPDLPPGKFCCRQS